MRNRCEYCNHKFKYREIVTSAWRVKGYKNIKCEECSTEYKLTRYSNLLINILVTAPVLATNLIGSKILILYVLWLCIIISITPLLCIYKKI
ncbi:TIGR04104 family putative zinc finger protein [Clostridium sp. ZBS12]|uniref:TIGR04104 family putative zinc finger protein n=1 Tax=Clostridium sp. ZBS12 TaxID=2949972 RepID=UPI0020799437|nr:TIGR04104 family putative zinc finger protein [Clostridium sp. ZBS12]